MLSFILQVSLSQSEDPNSTVKDPFDAQSAKVYPPPALWFKCTTTLLSMDTFWCCRTPSRPDLVMHTDSAASRVHKVDRASLNRATTCDYCLHSDTYAPQTARLPSLTAKHTRSSRSCFSHLRGLVLRVPVASGGNCVDVVLLALLPPFLKRRMLAESSVF